MGHVGWRYPYRRWGYGWSRWLSILNLRPLMWDLRDLCQRAVRGWGDGDIFDLMSYHAGVTLGLLKHFRQHHVGYPGGMTNEEYEAKLDLAIDGWQAKCNLFGDVGWEGDISYEEWSAPLVARWAKGHAVFMEIYDTLWN